MVLVYFDDERRKALPEGTTVRGDPPLITLQNGEQGYSFKRAQKLLREIYEETKDIMPYGVTENGCVDRSDYFYGRLCEKGADTWYFERIFISIPDKSNAMHQDWHGWVYEDKEPKRSYMRPYAQLENKNYQDAIETIQAKPENKPFIKGMTIPCGKTTFYFPNDNLRTLIVSHKGEVNGKEVEVKYPPLKRIEQPYFPGHIAIAIKVYDPDQEKMVRMILDPSFSPDKPLTLKEWEDLVGVDSLGSNQEHIYVCANVYDNKFRVARDLLTDRQEAFWEACETNGMNEEEITAELFHTSKEDIEHPSKWGKTTTIPFMDARPEFKIAGTNWEQIPAPQSSGEFYVDPDELGAQESWDEWNERKQMCELYVKPLMDYEIQMREGGLLTPEKLEEAIAKRREENGPRSATILAKRDAPDSSRER